MSSFHNIKIANKSQVPHSIFLRSKILAGWIGAFIQLPSDTIYIYGPKYLPKKPYKSIIELLVHETIHIVLFDLFGFYTSESMDNIFADKDFG